MRNRGHRQVPGSCGGQAWATRGPSVASRGQGVCPGAIGRALGRALTKRTSDTLNVAGRLGGPDSVWNTSGRDFRAPVLGLHCRCPYGTTLECVCLADRSDVSLSLIRAGNRVSFQVNGDMTRHSSASHTRDTRGAHISQMSTAAVRTVAAAQLRRRSRTGTARTSARHCTGVADAGWLSWSWLWLS